MKIKIPFTLEELEHLADAIASYHADCSEGVRKVLEGMVERIEKGKEMITVEDVDARCVDTSDMPVPISFRTTAAFLPSTKPLSL